MIFFDSVKLPSLRSEELLNEIFPKKEGTREAYGETLLELAENDERIVALSADLAVSTKVDKFGKKFPKRFFNMGVAEQNMIDFAGGLAQVGLIPFVSTFAIFASGRAWEQVRSVAHNRFNVKIVATHGGITVGADGATHQANEDIAVMKAIPNMVVIMPADAVETRFMIREIVKYDGPCYVRLSREKFPVIFDHNYRFKLGKAHVVREGKDCVIFACGLMVAHSLCAARMLEEERIKVTVVNVSTIKPIDEETIVKYAKICGRAITVEEHSISGGLGSAVCEVLAQKCPIPVKMLGVKDVFGVSGTAKDLLKYHHLMPEDISQAVISFDS